MSKQKIQNGVLYNSVKSINEMLQIDLPPIPTLKLAKNVKAITSANKIVDEVRGKLIQKYGTESKEGAKDWSIKPDDKSFKAFLKDFDEILKEETSINIDKITITANFPNLKGALVLSLEFMFEGLDEEPATKKATPKKVK